MDNLRPKTQTSPLQSWNFGEVKNEIKILIVEDLESDRFSYKRYLTSDPEQKYHIAEAETLEEGLELWRSQQPDVVLLDINLPDGDGLEFLEEISTGQLINKLPVIMLTGQGDERIAVRAMKLGAADYLVKSDVTAISLLTCINQVQENNLLFRQLRRSQQQQTIIASMSLHIRRSVSFEDVSNAIVQEIRSFLAADRTIIYRFHPDMSGEIVAEAVFAPWESCLDSQVEDACFQENLGGEYQNGKIFMAQDIYEANLTDCHIQLLERYQVRANLVVPILMNGTNDLWGLLIVHQCSSPRRWNEEDIQLLHQLSVHLAIALRQAELYHNLQTMNSLLEEKVQERTKKLQLQSQVLEKIHDGVVTTDLNGTILSWNHGAEKLYGYTEAEILGRNVAFMYEDAEALQSEVLVPLLSKGSHSAEVIVRSKSGQRLYVSLRLSVVRDEQGNITHLIGCANDITEQKQAEIALKESERSYVSLMAASPVGIFRTDPMGYCTYINDRWCRISGLTLETAMGDGWQQGIHPEDRQLVTDEWYQSVQENRPFSLEYRFQRPDGVVTWVYGQSVAKRNDDGIVTGYVGTITDISDRKEVEEQLRQLNDQLETQVEQRNAELKQSQIRLQEVQTFARLGSWELDVATREVRWSQELFDIFKIDPEYGLLTFEQLSSYFTPKYNKLRNELVEQAIRYAEPFETDLQIVRADGTIGYILAKAKPIVSEAGQVTRLLGIAMDISDRKIAEENLRESEQRFVTLAEAAPVAIFRMNQANECIYVNQFWSQITGQEALAALGHGWFDTIHPDDQASIQAEWIKVLSQNGYYKGEGRSLRPDGTICWYYCQAIPELNENGDVIGYIGTLTDISDRKRIESALTESEAKFRRLVEGANDVIWSTDTHGIFNYLSPQFQTIFGFEPNDWIGKTAIEFVHPEDRAWVISEQMRSIQSEQKVNYIEFRHRHRDGHYIWVSVNSTPIINAQGVPLGLQGILTDISERKKSEQEILENHRMIQQIADSSPNVLYLYDLQEQRNTYANREILVALGYSATEVQEMGAAWLTSVIHPDNISSTLEHFERLKLAHDGEIFSNEYRFRHANGEWRYFFSRDSIFSRDVHGQVKLIIGTAQDITDRKYAEAALRASDQRWQFALESAGDGIWDWNIQTHEVFFSQQWKALLGYADDEIENRFESWENLVHPDDIAQCYENIDKCLNHETLLYENEHRLRCKDGSYKWILARGKVFERTADGQALRMMGTHTDLSDRKRAALELQQLSERLTLALKSGAIGCWDWNSTDNSLYWDDRMYEIYGITKQSDDRLTYEIWINSVHPDDIAATKALVEQAAFGIPEFDTEFRIVRLDGEIRFIKAYGVVIRDSFGNAQSMIGINFDISDRKQAEAQLQQINNELLRATKLKDEFLANMSHELRTPLNAILGMSEALIDQVLGSINERQQKAIGNIERSGRHLLELINDILDLSKIASGKMALNRTSTSITNLCSASEVFVRQQAFQKNIQIISNIPPNLRDLNVDERRIKQVLINLLTNAVKFTPNDGQINFSVAVGYGNTWLGEAQIPNQIRAENAPMLLFQITDTGIGIAADDLPRLFQPFVQVDSNLNRQYEGTGLGLAMVKQIVELHGGQVTVASQLGQGSCFTVALPYEMSDSSGSKTSNESITASVMASSENAIAPLILLAEDNEANISNFTIYLTALNYRLIVAKNGQEAIALAKSEKPHIILMDIQMPLMDGLEAMRLIRADAEIANIPIIALTALAMQGDRERCLEAGANEYISKPVRLKQLALKITELLGD